MMANNGEIVSLPDELGASLDVECIVNVKRHGKVDFGHCLDRVRVGRPKCWIVLGLINDLDTDYVVTFIIIS